MVEPDTERFFTMGGQLFSLFFSHLGYIHLSPGIFFDMMIVYNPEGGGGGYTTVLDT